MHLSVICIEMNINNYMYKRRLFYLIMAFSDIYMLELDDNDKQHDPDVTLK